MSAGEVVFWPGGDNPGAYMPAMHPAHGSACDVREARKQAEMAGCCGRRGGGWSFCRRTGPSPSPSPKGRWSGGFLPIAIPA